MDLLQRIQLMEQLGVYMQQNNPEWVSAKLRASQVNPWFLPEFIESAVQNIYSQFLNANELSNWVKKYYPNNTASSPKNIGIVMAGNIPLVGFHDFLCVFISGHKATIKPSSKDEILIKHLVEKLIEWAPELKESISFAEQLKNCDAYIATGSNNSSRYFDYYFGKYPNIIRRNRTSVAVLTGNENKDALSRLATDIQLYFGLGCRNVTKLYVPENYDFIPLLQALKKYDYYMDFHKYKHNYDYQLAVLIMSNQLYMTNESVLLVEKEALFSPVAQIHYSYYDNASKLYETLQMNSDIQCIVGQNYVGFGEAQTPGLFDYADGIDTMDFLKKLNNTTIQ